MLTIVAALMVLSWSGCTRGCGETGPTPAAPVVASPRGPVVLEIGRHRFDQADLDMRAQLIRYRYPESSGAETGAISQLVMGYLYVELLAFLERPVTEQDLDAEIRRVAASTQDPQGLARYQEIGGGRDSVGYRRIVILPDFANTRFHFQVFPTHEAIHREARLLSEALLRKLLARGEAADPAAEALPDKALHERLAFSPKLGFCPLERVEDGLKHLEPGARNETAERIESHVFAALPQGRMHHETVEMPEAYCLLRWLGWVSEKDGVRLVERLRIPRAQAEDYFWEKITALPVRIADAARRETFLKEVSWARKLKVL